MGKRGKTAAERGRQAARHDAEGRVAAAPVVTETRARDDERDDDKLPILTEAGQRLAMVMLDPEYATASGAERAKAAGISLRHYWRLLADPDYHLAVQARAAALIDPHLVGILEAAIATAKEPGRDGHQDRAMLLRIRGILEDRRRVEHGGVISHTAVLPAADVEARLSQLELPPAEDLQPVDVGGGDTDGDDGDSESPI